MSGFNALLAAHHYLGPRGSARLLRYVALLDGQPAVLATFGAAVRRCRPREQLLGWDDEQRAARLRAVAGNQRLCVLPAGRVPNLASAALAGMLRRLPGDHLAACGQPLVAAETFTDPARGPGTVYAAAGFTPAGLTAGYSRSRGRSDYVFHGAPKQYWLRGLGKVAAADLPGLLSAAFDSPLITSPGGKGRTDVNKTNIDGRAGDGSRGLLEHLRDVTDHRKARGKRHPLEAILVVIAVARLCGADSVHAVGQHAATMPQQALARCGLRRNPRTGRYHPPSLKTIKRAIRDTDAHAADAALCAWLRQEAAAGRVRVRHLAAGGKTVRGARDKAGHAPHLLAARDVTGGTVAAQLDVAARHNEITYFAGLLACLSDPAPAGAGHDSDSDDEDTCRGETGSDAGSKGCITLITADALCRRVDYAEVRSGDAAGSGVTDREVGIITGFRGRP